MPPKAPSDMTVAQIKKALQKAKIAFDPKAKKADLVALLEVRVLVLDAWGGGSGSPASFCCLAVRTG
jgi:hypothetical protein